MDINHIARVCHEVNAAYCRSLGDTSQLPWDQAPQWQRDSAVAGVKFLLDNPDARAGYCHANWLADKRKDGWIYGPVKDPATKRHPCMVPFTELPEEQQTKDHLFVAVVRACQEASYLKTVEHERDLLLEEKMRLIMIIRDMHAHEGAEGWSEDLKRRINVVLP